MSFFVVDGIRYGDQFEHQSERIERTSDAWERQELYGHMRGFDYPRRKP